MKALLLGSGGREHALFWKMSQSPQAEIIHAFPGNGGFPPEAIIANPELDLSNPASLSSFVEKEGYDLVVVGPEQPLVNGVVDVLQNICPVFGPVQQAARLEGSKEYAKKIMKQTGVPTAAAESFTDLKRALEYMSGRALPLVIKADGLAAGKGVTVAESAAQAEEAVRNCLEKRAFAEAGSRVLIEDFLEGEEASVFAFCDGERALTFIAARDYKRAHDEDRGPNTGGMGAFAPAPVVSPEVAERVRREIIEPVLSAMRAGGTPYRGLLYAGLMIHEKRPRVVEFNVRFGDPETQPLLRLLDEDILELMMLSARGELPDRPLKFQAGAAVVIVMAAEGYPGSYRKDIPLSGLDGLPEDIVCFHAGTYRRSDAVFSNGGRILGLTATGGDLSQAVDRAYSQMSKINVPGTFYRHDIGKRGRIR